MTDVPAPAVTAVPIPAVAPPVAAAPPASVMPVAAPAVVTSIAEVVAEAVSEFDQLRINYAALITGVHQLLSAADPTEHRNIGKLRDVMVELGHSVPSLPF